MKKMMLKGIAAAAAAALVPIIPAAEAAENAGVRTVNAYVNTFDEKQTILGVGGGITWYNNWLTETPNKDEIYDLLFNKTGLDLIRIKNFYAYEGIELNADSDKENIESAEKAAGKEIPVLMSSWSPNGTVKSNGVYNGGGTIKKNAGGSFAYDEYAEYYTDMLKAYRDAGVKIDYFSIQNEPDFRADYDGCELDPEEGANARYSKAFNAVYDAFSKLDNPPKLVGPDSMTASFTNIKKYVQPLIDEGDGRLAVIAHHLYTGGNEENPDQYKKSMNKLRDIYPDIPKWQTEYYRGNGIQTAWLMTNVFVEEGGEAYFYWDTIWGPDGTLVALENPWDKSSWKTEKGYTVNDKIYALAHFAAFTDGGYVRVDSSVDPEAQDIKLAAFNSPDKDRLSVILTNTKNADAEVKLNLNGYEIQKSTVYRTDYRENGKERMADLGPLGADMTLTLSAQCIVTVDITGKQGKKPDTILKAAAAEEAKSEEAKLVYGTPVIDGKAETAWDKAEWTEMKNAAHGDHGASAKFKTMWDEKNLYVLMDVTDENLDDSAQNPYEQDSVEIFVNERGDKPDAYDKGDGQYRVNYKNVQSFGTGGEEKNFKTAVVKTDKGYMVEAAIAFTVIEPENGGAIGFDAQVNDSHGKGQRDYILKWSDPTDNTWGNLEDIGTLVLDGAAVKDSAVKDGEITVTANGKRVVFTDVKPMIMNDRVMIPLRAAAETVGKKVEWMDSARAVVISSDGKTPEITGAAGETVRVFTDGREVVFPDQKPVIVDGRTMLPLRTLSESLGMAVEWDESSRSVTVK